MSSSAHTRPWQIFEVVVGSPMLLAAALHALLPLPIGGAQHAALRVGAGAALLVGGALLVGATRRQMRALHQPTDPGQPTTRLVTGGVFAWSRNPLYLGGFAALAGLALALGAAWGLIMLLPALAAAHALLIRPEERYLEATFGAEYRAYAARVRRWVGRG